MNQDMSRRSVIKTVAAGAAAAFLTGKASETMAMEDKAVPQYKNSDFYKDGKFDKAAAKQAYYDMMKRFNYPVYDRLKTDDFWAIDFACNDFIHAGMGGIFWWNDKEQEYFGHEIFLLPGQMIVEHAHFKTDKKPKMEAWQVRHGMIYTFGEGEETKPCPVELPKSQEGFITCKHCEPLKLGEIRGLNRPQAFHFMYAGPEGAIVTEYATYHDGAGLRFTNTNVKL